MSDSKLYTKEAQMRKAAVIATSLAASKVRFFSDALVPTDDTTKAQLVAAVVEYDGMTAGGETLATWTGGLLDENGGAPTTSPLKHVAYGPAADPPVAGLVGGYWIEDATGNVREVGIYNPARPFAVLGDGFEWVEQIIEGRNV